MSGPGNWVRHERAIDVRAAIQRVERESDRKPKEHRDPAWTCQRRESRVRDRLGQADVEVEPERCGNFVLKELSQARTARSTTTPPRGCVGGLAVQMTSLSACSCASNLLPCSWTL